MRRSLRVVQETSNANNAVCPTSPSKSPDGDTGRFVAPIRITRSVGLAGPQLCVRPVAVEEAPSLTRSLARTVRELCDVTACREPYVPSVLIHAIDWLMPQFG